MSTVEAKDLHEAQKHIICGLKSGSFDENEKEFGFSIAFREIFGIIVFGKKKDMIISRRMNLDGM